MSEFSMNHRINRVRQPGPNDCWAACLVMKLEAASRHCYEVEGLKRTATERGVTLHADGTLARDEDNMNTLGRAFRINILKNRGVVRINDLVPYLRQAPLILFGAFNYPDRRNPMNHAVLLGGMWGDGSDDTGLSIVDPASTGAGFSSETDDVFTWRDFCNNIVDRLDYVSVLN